MDATWCALLAGFGTAVVCLNAPAGWEKLCDCLEVHSGPNTNGGLSLFQGVPYSSPPANWSPKWGSPPAYWSPEGREEGEKGEWGSSPPANWSPEWRSPEWNNTPPSGSSPPANWSPEWRSPEWNNTPPSGPDNSPCSQIEFNLQCLTTPGCVYDEAAFVCRTCAGCECYKSEHCESFGCYLLSDGLCTEQPSDECYGRRNRELCHANGADCAWDSRTSSCFECDSAECACRAVDDCERGSAGSEGRECYVAEIEGGDSECLERPSEGNCWDYPAGAKDACEAADGCVYREPEDVVTAAGHLNHDGEELGWCEVCGPCECRGERECSADGDANGDSECVWQDGECLKDGACWERGSKSKCKKKSECFWEESGEYCYDCGPCGCIEDADECQASDECLFDEDYQYCRECWGCECSGEEDECTSGDTGDSCSWASGRCVETPHSCYDIYFKKGCKSGDLIEGCTWDGEHQYCYQCESCDCFADEFECNGSDGCAWNADHEHCSLEPSWCYERWESSCKYAPECFWDPSSDYCYECEGCNCAQGNATACLSFTGGECAYSSSTEMCYSADGYCWDMPSEESCNANPGGCSWRRHEHWDQGEMDGYMYECEECNDCHCLTSATSCDQQEYCKWGTEPIYSPSGRQTGEEEACVPCEDPCSCTTNEDECVVKEDFYGSLCFWTGDTCSSENADCHNFRDQDACTSIAKCGWEEPTCRDCEPYCYECGDGCHCSQDEDSCNDRESCVWGTEHKDIGFGRWEDVPACVWCEGCSCFASEDECVAEDMCFFDENSNKCVSSDSSCVDRPSQKSCEKRSGCKWEPDCGRDCGDYCYTCDHDCSCFEDDDDACNAMEHCAYGTFMEWDDRKQKEVERETCRWCHGCDCYNDAGACESEGCTWGEDSGKCFDLGNNVKCWELTDGDVCSSADNCKWEERFWDNADGQYQPYCTDCYSGCECNDTPEKCMEDSQCRWAPKLVPKLDGRGEEEIEQCQYCSGCGCGSSESECRSMGCNWVPKANACIAENPYCEDATDSATCDAINDVVDYNCAWDHHHEYCKECDCSCLTDPQRCENSGCRWNDGRPGWCEHKSDACTEQSKSSECDDLDHCMWDTQSRYCRDMPTDCWEASSRRDCDGLAELAGMSCEWDGGCYKPHEEQKNCASYPIQNNCQDNGCEWLNGVCFEYHDISDGGWKDCANRFSFMKDDCKNAGCEWDKDTFICSEPFNVDSCWDIWDPRDCDKSGCEWNISNDYCKPPEEKKKKKKEKEKKKKSKKKKLSKKDIKKLCKKASKSKSKCKKEKEHCTYKKKKCSPK